MPSQCPSVGGWANSHGQGMSHLQTSNQSPSTCHCGTFAIAHPPRLRAIVPSLANRGAARKRGRFYEERFIVNLNIVIQPSLPCISLHASYEVSLNRVQRTR